MSKKKNVPAERALRISKYNISTKSDALLSMPRGLGVKCVHVSDVEDRGGHVRRVDAVHWDKDSRLIPDDLRSILVYAESLSYDCIYVSDTMEPVPFLHDFTPEWDGSCYSVIEFFASGVLRENRFNMDHDVRGTHMYYHDFPSDLFVPDKDDLSMLTSSEYGPEMALDMAMADHCILYVNVLLNVMLVLIRNAVPYDMANDKLIKQFVQNCLGFSNRALWNQCVSTLISLGGSPDDFCPVLNYCGTKNGGRPSRPPARIFMFCNYRK